MKKSEVYVFIDALGWKIVDDNKFMSDILMHRQKVKMQFGYSSAAVPTILTGEYPSIHKHFSFFFYDPKDSPFKFFRFIKYFFGAGLHPKCLFNKNRVRRIISKITAKLKGYTGYFNLYSVPYDKLSILNYCEKYDIFAKDGLSPIKNLRDILEESGLDFHISDWRKSESENFVDAQDAIKRGADFVFVYTGNFDAFMHDNLLDKKSVSAQLKLYENYLLALINTLKENRENFNLTIISDHGMTPTKGTVDLMKIIKNLRLKFGRDYVAFFDSTMARFWYPRKSNSARNAIVNALKNESGKFLTDEEKHKYGIDFKDNQYGEDIFLMEEGIQISPCDLDTKPMKGMHGYSPEAVDSYASYLSTKEPNATLQEVKDFFILMKNDIENLKK